jgi:hypothetical protein
LHSAQRYTRSVFAGRAADKAHRIKEITGAAMHTYRNLPSGASLVLHSWDAVRGRWRIENCVGEIWQFLHGNRLAAEKVNA